MGQTARQYEGQIVKNVRLDYLLYLPKDYEKDTTVSHPLILFLHGAGERGSDIDLIRKHGIPKVVENNPEFPFIAVSPQCSETSWWDAETDSLIAIVEHVKEQYRVDDTRVYVTGLSMGGYGTWALAIERPDLFAAAVPICGGGRTARIQRIKDIPTWVFHGAKDDVVPLSESEKMVNALRACGGKVEFTVYPDAKHDSWTETYDNPKLYEWLLSHRKVR